MDALTKRKLVQASKLLEILPKGNVFSEAVKDALRQIERLEAENSRLASQNEVLRDSPDHDTMPIRLIHCPVVQQWSAVNE